MSPMQQHTEENLIVLSILIACTLGLYSLIWLARTSRAFGDDPTTNVVLVIGSFGMWSLVLNLRYLERSEALNGRSLAWYNAALIFVTGGIIGPLITQMNINEKLGTTHTEAASPTPL